MEALRNSLLTVSMEAFQSLIEGGEVLALGGMVRLLEQDRPLVFLELHGPEAAETAWGTFTTAGYRICQMKPNLPEVHCLSDLDWKAYLVAVP